MGSAGGSAGGSADNVYFHPDTSKFDVVNVYIHAGGGDQGHHTRMGGGYFNIQTLISIKYAPKGWGSSEAAAFVFGVCMQLL